MYKEQRAVAAEQATASTPEMWAANFAASKRMTARLAAKLRSSHEWKIVRRTFPAGSRVLDAGCGFGEWVALLREEGYDAFGVDYSSDLIERLRAAYPQSDWVQSDIRTMPVADGSVDGVISWGVIEHDEEGPGAALREFHRIVRPGGAIVISVPFDSPAMRKTSQVQFPPTSRMAFFQYFMTEAELADHVRKAGFDATETGTLAHGSFAIFAPRWYGRATGLPLRVGNRLGDILLQPFKKYRGMIYCVGRKPLS